VSSSSSSSLPSSWSSSSSSGFCRSGHRQLPSDQEDRRFRTDLGSERPSPLLRAKVTLLRSLCLCREMMAKSSGARRALSGSETVTTVPSCPSRNAMNSEQGPHSQKYSTLLWRLASRLAEGVDPGSASSRKSLPSWRLRNDAEHDRLAHFATIQNPSPFPCLYSVARGPWLQ
jgi:hypothetical protein